jgi:poly(A) polymerase
MSHRTTMMTEPHTVEQRRTILTDALLAEDPSAPLWQLVESGLADEIVPELPSLELEQDPIHKHKDVLAHTIAVTAKTRCDLRLRLAALFHDIGKPATRSFRHGGVTFRHHEAVGAKITRARLAALEYPPDVVDDVSELVRLSGRFKGFADGWSDSAVRRYARDCGHLLGLLNELVRSDCTTRNRRKALELQHHVDELEERIAELAEADRLAAERPLLDGDAVMNHLGLEPGPEVGKALAFLLELRRSEPDLDLEKTIIRLDDWWAASS